MQINEIDVDINSKNAEIFKDYIDPWYDELRNKIQKNPLYYPAWRVDDNIIYYKTKTKFPVLADSDYMWKTVVPVSHRNIIIRNNYDSITSGHSGIYKTFHRIANRFYWPKMKSDITRYINHCHKCLAFKSEQKLPLGQMSSRLNITKPWELITVDLVGPLPKSSKGFIYIFSVCDYFSKFVFFFPLRTATASNICKLLEDNVFMLVGVPKYIVTDNGPQFRSAIFKNLAKQYGVEIKYTALYHPQSNAVERVHRVLNTMLGCYADGNQRNWDINLQKVACAIRSAKHEATQMSPYFINFGREMNLTGEGSGCAQILDTDVKVTMDRSHQEDRAEELKSVFQEVRKNLDKASIRASQTYNLRHRNEQFNIGQKVWRKNFILSDASKYISKKLCPKFIGPLTVHKKVSPWTYTLKDEKGKICGTYNIKDLKSHPPE